MIILNYQQVIMAVLLREQMRNLFSVQYSLLIFLYLSVAFAHAQDNIPTHPVDGTFIKKWLVLGPFFPDDLETDFLASINGETHANPKPGDTVTTAEGETLTWTVYRTEGNIIDLQHAIGKHEEAICYAFCLLESDLDGDGEFLVGSDDSVAVFLNGQRVHTQSVLREIAIDDDRFPVTLRPGKIRCLMKISNGLQDWALTTRVIPPTRAVITGVITDETRNTLSKAIVHLWKDNTLIAKTETDTKGNYQLSIYPANGNYDMEASHGDKGNWTKVSLPDGARLNMNLTLRMTVSISGSLLKFDDKPHVGVLVEALLLDKKGSSQRRATTLSDNRGQYKFINLRPGRYQIRCHTLKTQGEDPNKIVSVVPQNTLENVNFRFLPFKYGTWKHYTYLDGLGSNHVRPIYQDREGFLWFGTLGGVSRYDGEKFVNFTTDDGLADNSVWSIHQDREGYLWFGTLDNGVSRYDGEKFVNFTTDDGLADNSGYFIHQDQNGVLWFGTSGGVSRYDGKAFVNYTTNDGLANDSVRVIHQDQKGHFWFGTSGGVSRYDGEKFVNFTTNNGLVSNLVRTIHQDQDDFLWFGSWYDGISRYDGDRFINFTTDDGLTDNAVSNITQDRAGGFWISTEGKGLSQYDSSSFINFTTADGLVDNLVYTVYQDREGLIWFGTEGELANMMAISLSTLQLIMDSYLTMYGQSIKTKMDTSGSEQMMMSLAMMV